MIDSNKLSKLLLVIGIITITGGGGIIYINSQKEKSENPSAEINSNKKDLILGEDEAQMPDFMNEKSSGFVMDDNFFRHKKIEEEPEEEIFVEEEPKPKGKFTKHSEEPINKQPNLSEVLAFKDPQLPERRVESLGVSPTPILEEKVDLVTKLHSPYGVNGFNRFIAQETEERAEEKLAKFLADEENPTNIASQPYDLSRVVTTDTFIPAVMYTAVNSEIPSKTVLAVVESDVVGFHGRNILIPKGSKVEGVYEQLSSKTARRMQITWFKITRPDGIIIKLSNAESGDQQGAGGLSGYLDQRLKDRYGAALLLSLINASAQLSVNTNNVNQLAAVESFSRESATLTAQIIRENINTLPVIMIRQGARFNIRPLQNIYFPEYKSGSGVIEASLIKN